MYECEGQIDLFSYLEEQGQAEKKQSAWDRRKKVGDLVARTFLGDCHVSRITKVEGNEKFFFYRTDSGGCFTPEEADVPVSECLKKAKAWKGDRVRPEGLEHRMTWRYVRECDGNTMWAQIGIWKGMLYWKDACTYEFLEKTDNLKWDYEKQLEQIRFNLHDQYESGRVDEEIKMGWLYKCRSGHTYASAEYAARNY